MVEYLQPVGKTGPLQEDHVARIDGADGGDAALVKGGQLRDKAVKERQRARSKAHSPPRSSVPDSALPVFSTAQWSAADFPGS